MEQQETLDHELEAAFAELGLNAAATQREFKAAWRRLVSQWHPDRNDSALALARMQRINRAVEAIRRAGFDRPEAFPGADRAAPDGPPAPGRAGQPAPSGTDPDADPGDAKPAAAARPDRTPAPPIRRRVRLTLEEAALGCTKALRGRLTQACLACDGTGHRVLAGHCPACKGAGAVRQSAWFGWLGAQVECDTCSGSGTAKAVCDACSGSGKAASQRYKLAVRFPPGLRGGDQLSAKGQAGKPGAPPGELSIDVQVLPHALFKLDEDGTVRCHMPVEGFAWMANRPVDVPTLGGVQAMSLQREQLSYRLKGEGFPVQRRGPRGDLLFSITPVFPPVMSADQHKLIDQLIATTTGPDARPRDVQLQRWQEAMQACQVRERARRR